MILVGCGACGYGAARESLREERMLRQFQRMLQVMVSELRYRLTPLPELVTMAAKETTGDLRKIMDRFSLLLAGGTLPDAASCMDSAMHPSILLAASVRAALLRLGASLGRFDLPGQLDGLGALQTETLQMLESLASNRAERIRSWRTLAICAGAALVVLFL